MESKRLYKSTKKSNLLSDLKVQNLLEFVNKNGMELKVKT